MRDDGTFLEWVRREFDWSKSSAYRFMDVAAAFPNLGSGRDALADGETFDAWLRAEFEWSRRTAYNFIGVAERCANFAREDAGQIDVSALYLLARPSTAEPVREAAIERAAVGAEIATMRHGGDRGNQHTGGKRSDDRLNVSNAQAAEIVGVGEA
jgi:hypothetical protein